MGFLEKVPVVLFKNDFGKGFKSILAGYRCTGFTFGLMAGK